jgi:geranylgeranyl diphosphate synthase, type II
MHSAEQLQSIINQEIAMIHFSREPAELYEPIKYMMDLGGKRLRPLLCLLACDLFDEDIQKAISPAIGLEIFHNFTLLHDDIMDEAPIRRCMPTVYKKWNRNIAILSGDTMMAMAYEYLLKTPEHVRNEVLAVFNQTAISVCEGQQYDMNFETDDNVSIQDYVRMIRLKTAVLIAGSLKVGAMVGGASPADGDNLYSFGLQTGIAFQIKDDLLDVFGDDKKFGKMKGGDIAINKKTFLYLKALELADAGQKEKLQRYFSLEFSGREEKIPGVIKIYEEIGLKDVTRKEMEKYHRTALEFLAEIDLDESRKSELKKIADKMMVRDI